VMSERDIGEDLYGQAADRGASGITREVPKGKRKVTSMPVVDPRLVPGREESLLAKTVPWEASKEDRMSPAAAGKKLEELYCVYGIQAADVNFQYAFLDAFLFQHTLNGSSVMQPGRAIITVGGEELDVQYGIQFLGPDARRFFRAFADETRRVNNAVLSRGRDVNDIVAWGQAELLRQTAKNRGMSRHPDLAHDTADACSHLNESEHTALMSSKNAIFSTSVNTADRNRRLPGLTGESSTGNLYDDPTARAHALAARG